MHIYIYTYIHIYIYTYIHVYIYIYVCVFLAEIPRCLQGLRSRMYGQGLAIGPWVTGYPVDSLLRNDQSLPCGGSVVSIVLATLVPSHPSSGIPKYGK